MNIIYTFTNRQGIGDNLRGLIAVLQVVKKIETKKKFQFHVDFSESHINKFLMHKLPDNLLQLKQTPQTEIKNFYCRYIHNGPIDKGSQDDIINYLLNSHSTMFCINSNFFPEIDDINEDIKTFVKNLFKFNEDFKNVFNSYLNQIPKDYILYHYRLGDFMFHNNTIVFNHNWNDNNTNFDQFIESYSELSKQNENYAGLILSDSLNFKKKIYEIYNNIDTIVFLNKPTHIAYTNDVDNINIFIDFFLVTKAKTIYSYSYYPWISNFVLWNSYIYDIPHFQITNK
jgi:hypothetical protein